MSNVVDELQLWDEILSRLSRVEAALAAVDAVQAANAVDERRTAAVAEIDERRRVAIAQFEERADVAVGRVRAALQELRNEREAIAAQERAHVDLESLAGGHPYKKVVRDATGNMVGVIDVGAPSSGNSAVRA
jgi:hypothetical protein